MVNVATTAVFNPAATIIIAETLRIMGVINEDETPTAGQYESGMFALNSLMKFMETEGIHLWTEEEGIVFLQKGQRTYLLGGTTSDKACDAMQWTQTTLAQSVAAGSASVVVSSTTGLVVGHNFGVYLNAGNLFWSTILTIVGTTVTLNAVLTGAASSGAWVGGYPTAAQLERPLQIPFARRLLYQTVSGQVAAQAPDWGGIITPVSPMTARQDFMDLPQPNTPGNVNQVFYNPGRDQGQLWVWNVLAYANLGLRFTYYRSIRDFLTGNNTGDFPQEWIDPIQWILARRMGPRYSIPAERWDRIKAEAEIMWDKVQGWDREKESIYFGRTSRYGR